MATSKLRRAIGAVKDKTSIGLAKVGSKASLSDLEVAIVKATSHQEYPPEEKHVREILSLTCYNKGYVTACVNFLTRRLNKTRCWTVALKTLMLIQRLISEGDPSYEPEIFFTTRRGTRLLNMPDFRDNKPSGSWAYSAFVRTFALYLDERLEYRMQGRKGKKVGFEHDEEEENHYEHIRYDTPIRRQAPVKATPVHESKTEQLFSRAHHLQLILQRFLECRPTGAAKTNPVVLAALYPTLRESYRTYNNITEVMSVMIDRFMELEVNDCMKVYDIFAKISKQFDELDEFYSWCKTVGVARSSDIPQLEKITQKRLDVMDEFIRDKTLLAQTKKIGKENEPKKEEPEEAKEPQNVQDEKARATTLTSPVRKLEEDPMKEETAEVAAAVQKKAEAETQTQTDLLNIGEDVVMAEDAGDRLPLALFDGGAPAQNVNTNPATAAPVWEAFSPEDNWETTLVRSDSHLPNQKVALGGGLDMLMLDSMYQQQQPGMMVPYTGLGSSTGHQPMLALPAPPSANVDPFAASMGVAPPPYAQMLETEKRQRMLVEQQLMWQQHQAYQMQQGHLGYSNPFNQGGYQQRF